MPDTNAAGVGPLWIKIAVVYLLIGMLLGMIMGGTHNFEYVPIHAHLNLLGWATMALSGLIYQLYPKAAASPLQRWHFWLHNTGLPVMMLSLFCTLAGRTEIMPGIFVGAILVFVGTLLLAVNLFRNAR